MASLVRKVEGRSGARSTALKQSPSIRLPPDRKRPRKHTVGSATHDFHRTGLPSATERQPTLAAGGIRAGASRQVKARELSMALPTTETLGRYACPGKSGQIALRFNGIAREDPQNSGVRDSKV